MQPTKQYERGLVVGKFCPLHKGHEYLIARALDACERVTIISYTKPEFSHCDRAAREGWLMSLFPQAETLVIDDESLQERCRKQGLPIMEVPHNDAPDDVHRNFVGRLCCEVLSHTINAVFTSEDYGDGFAAYLSSYFSAHTKRNIAVAHICVDMPRLVVPVSGTAIRKSPHTHRGLLSPIVYAGFVKRVCFLGGESSGKTTLAQAVADALSTAWVPEYGRELWDKKQGKLGYDDMLHIAHEQVEREVRLAASADEWLICDTSPLTTLFYSLSMFGKAAPELEALAYRRYDGVFLCAPDFSFVQDGTRQNDEFRALQHAWYLKALGERNVDFEIITGPLETRVARVSALLAEV